MEILFVTIFASLMAYWIYAHLRFWWVLKEEAPEIYSKHNNLSFLSVGGFKWVDYALSRKYKELKNARITKAGNTLCKAYLGLTTVNGLLFLVAELIFVIVLAWSITKYVT